MLNSKLCQQVTRDAASFGKADLASALSEIEKTTYRGLTLCRSEAGRVISEGAGCLPSTPRSIYDFTTQKVDDSIHTVTKYLQQTSCFLKAYNPVNLMMKSDNAYIREPTQFVQEQFNTALLYLFKKPKRFIKLLMAIGVPVPPETITAIMLENSAEILHDFSIEGFENAIHADKYLSKNLNKSKAKLLLALLQSPGETYESSMKTLNEKAVNLLEAAFMKFMTTEPSTMKNPAAEKPLTQIKKKRKYYRP